MRGSSGRPVTWLVALAVGALGAAAIVDAVRADDDDPQTERREGAAAPLRGVASDLATAGVEGTLVYLDRACRLHVLGLPDLRTLDGGPSRDCRLSPTFASPRALPISAATSAVRRDGSVAFVRDGDVVVWPFGCIEAGGARCSRTVLPRAAVARELGTSAGRTSVGQVAWLGRSRLAAVVAVDGRSRRGKTLIAVFERRRLVGSVPWFRSRAVSFFVSPKGGYFAVATSGPDRFFLLDRDAGVGALADVARDWFGRTSLQDAHAVAWSPDERWTAMAKNESVYVFTTRDADPFLVRLPIEARDLAWRS